MANATWANRYNASQPIPDKQLEPDGSVVTLSGQTVSGPNATLAQRYATSPPFPDKWLNPDGSITAGNAAGGGGGGGGEVSYPPAGIPVSTGVGWGTSLNPDNSFLKLAGGNLTGAVNMQSQQLFFGNYTRIFGSGNQLLLYGFRNTFIYANNGTTPMLDIGGAAGGMDRIVAYMPITLPADPTQPLQAATKQYVDNSVPQVIQVADEATALSSSAANPNNFYFWV